jgi:hypothetical protein
MAKNFTTLGFSCHNIEDKDLIEWYEAMPKDARSAGIRAQLRYALRKQGKLPTDYQKGQYVTPGQAAPDLTEVKSMFQQLLDLIRDLTGREMYLSSRDAQGNLVAHDLGLEDEAVDGLTARMFGDGGEDEDYE